jgi:hypothetical protein
MFALFPETCGEKFRHRLDEPLSLTLSSTDFDVLMKSLKLFNFLSQFLQIRKLPSPQHTFTFNATLIFDTKHFLFPTPLKTFVNLSELFELPQKPQ